MSSEWFNRPDDERYLSLDDLWSSVKGRSERSQSFGTRTGDHLAGSEYTSVVAQHFRVADPGILDSSFKCNG